MDTTTAVRKVLEEEITRQRRKPGEVARVAGVGKNTLYRVFKDGADLTAPTLWALAASLEVPMTEIAFRVDQLRSGRTSNDGGVR